MESKITKTKKFKKVIAKLTHVYFGILCSILKVETYKSIF